MKYREPRKNLESSGAKKFINFLQSKGWSCWKLGGGKFTVGWPDYYCYHKNFGHRWVETKVKNRKLRPSQVKKFREFAAAGDKIYVIEVNHSNEELYAVLFADYDNWRVFIRE